MSATQSGHFRLSSRFTLVVAVASSTRLLLLYCRRFGFLCMVLCSHGLHGTLISAHLTYQSLEDWRGLRDIVRCNPSFHGYARYDSVLFNSDMPGLSFARLRNMFRCTLETKRQFDVAIVRQFRRSNWKPNTDWAGCQVHEETKGYSLLLMDYVMRGALLTPVTASGKNNLHYFKGARR